MKSKFLTLCKYLFFCAGVCLAAMATAGFVRGFWFCDLCSQFRLVFFFALLPITIALGLLKARWMAVFCFIVSAVNAFPLATMYTPVKYAGASEAPSQNNISVLNFNTEFQHNSNYEAFERLLQECNPDILALVELDQKWTDELREKTASFPYSKIVIKGPGLALFSKYPIERCQVKYFGKSHHPRILATIVVHGRPLFLMLAHPTTPQSERGYEERNRELALIGEEMKAAPVPSKLLIGDLNCGPWSPEFAALLQSASLLDSQQGFGPQPSWPGRINRITNILPVPPLIPIDHVLHSTDLRILKRECGPAIGSDHLPVFVKMAK